MRGCSAIGALVAGLFALACTVRSAPPPAEPAPQKVSQTKPKKERAKEEKEQPKLIAPPPAYGHKIVLAKGQQAPVTF